MGCISGLTLCQMCPSDGPTGCAYRIIGCAPAYGLMAKCAPRVRGWDYDVKRSSYTLSTTRGSPHLWKLNGHDGLLMLVADFAGVDWRGERPDVMSEPVYEKLVAKRGLMFNHRGQLVAFSLSNY